jgi:hypothetical protein
LQELGAVPPVQNAGERKPIAIENEQRVRAIHFD